MLRVSMRSPSPTPRGSHLAHERALIPTGHRAWEHVYVEGFCIVPARLARAPPVMRGDSQFAPHCPLTSQSLRPMKRNKAPAASTGSSPPRRDCVDTASPPAQQSTNAHRACAQWCVSGREAEAALSNRTVSVLLIPRHELVSRPDSSQSTATKSACGATSRTRASASVKLSTVTSIRNLAPRH